MGALRVVVWDHEIMGEIQRRVNWTGMWVRGRDEWGKRSDAIDGLTRAELVRTWTQSASAFVGDRTR